MKHTTYTGKAFATGDNTSSYLISYPARWKECGTDAEKLGKWLFEPLCPEFRNVPGAFKKLGYEILVSGVDLGGGFKSNDHPSLTVKGAGVKLIIADDFNRIFFRNCINLGNPVIVCPGISKIVKTGDTLTGDIATGVVKNETTGETLQGEPLSELAVNIIHAGGLIPYWKEKLATNQYE